MKSNLYSIYDIKAEYYSKPFVAQNDEVAQRLITNSFRDPQSSQSEYVLNPQDFQLVRLATFDDGDGHIEADMKPILDLITLRVNDNEE